MSEQQQRQPTQPTARDHNIVMMFGTDRKQILDLITALQSTADDRERVIAETDKIIATLRADNESLRAELNGLRPAPPNAEAAPAPV